MSKEEGGCTDMKFELVKKDQFERDFADAYTHYNLGLAIDETYNSSNIGNRDLRIQYLADSIYHSLKKPRRGTIGSAGYDFFYPRELRIPEQTTVKIPTGIAWNPETKEHQFVLSLYPRSSLGIKYSLREPNLVSIIDSDYYGCDQNGGHIFVYLRNEGHNGVCVIKPNTAYCQGVITIFYIVDDDDAQNTRTGGIGSTTKI